MSSLKRLDSDIEIISRGSTPLADDEELSEDFIDSSQEDSQYDYDDCSQEYREQSPEEEPKRVHSGFDDISKKMREGKNINSIYPYSTEAQRGYHIGVDTPTRGDTRRRSFKQRSGSLPPEDLGDIAPSFTYRESSPAYSSGSVYGHMVYLESSPAPDDDDTETIRRFSDESGSEVDKQEGMQGMDIEENRRLQALLSEAEKKNRMQRFSFSFCSCIFFCVLYFITFVNRHV